MSKQTGKTRRSVAILGSVLAINACLASSSPALKLSTDSKTEYRIVVARDAPAFEMTAARELQDHLNQVTGADFPIQDETSVDPGARQILVGQSDRVKSLAPDVDWASLKYDGILIRTKGENLILAGGRPRGALYAVYTFLEDVVGCRWWTSSESYIPSKKILIIPELNQFYTPKLAYREAYYRDPTENPLFAVKLKMNGFFFNIPKEYGGHYKFAGFVHTFYGLIPPDKYFDSHPEWFSEIGGKRIREHAQLCLSNDEMRIELIKNALNWLRSDPDCSIVSISQNDCHGPCECEKCKAIEKEEGSPSGPLIRFVNAVAEKIEKEFPEVLVETLAYQYTRKPPLMAKPRKNVIVRLCSIECDFSKPHDSEANKDFRHDVKGWSANAPNLFIWDYVTDFWCYMQPFPNLRVLAPNIRFFVDNRTIGLFEQGDSYTTTGDFIRLKTWLFGHLEWDPSRDENVLIDEFLNGYYGAAGPYLKKYLDLVHDAFARSGLKLPCGTEDLSYLTLPVMNQATGLFSKAEKAVANDPVLAARVRRERLPLDFAWLKRYKDLKAESLAGKASFDGPEDPVKACREFIELSRSWKTDFYKEGVPFETRITELEELFTSNPAPEEFAAIPEKDRIEITADQFFLWQAPELAQLVDDPLASTGKAARMPGTHNKYGIQFHIPKELAKRLQGQWKAYVIARCESGEKEGILRCGVFDKTLNHSVAWFDKNVERGWDGKYKTFYLGFRPLTDTMYLWVAPEGRKDRVKAIYVDRFILVRDKR